MAGSVDMQKCKMSSNVKVLALGHGGSDSEDGENFFLSPYKQFVVCHPEVLPPKEK